MLATASCFLVVVAGCVEADAPEGPSRDTLLELVVEPLPTVVIGEDEDRPGHVLHEVRDVRLLEDGGVVVLNGGDLEIRVFDANGRLRHRWGGGGEGPGEFRWIQGMHRLDGDTLLVMSHPRLVWVHPAEGVIRDVQYELPVHTDQCLSTEGDVTLLEGQILVGWKEMGVLGCGAAPEGRFRRETEYWRVHVGSGRVDTLGTFPGQERTGTAPLAHGRGLLAVPMGARTVLGETGGSWIRVYGSDPEAADEWASPFATRPVEREELGEWKALLTDRFQVEEEEIDRELQRLPSRLPAFGDLVVDGAGRLWVGRYEPFVFASEQEWVALQEGRAVARLRMPLGVRMLDLRGDVAVGLWYDEFLVERVGLFPVYADEAQGGSRIETNG